MSIVLGNYIFVEFMVCDLYVMNDVFLIECDMVGVVQLVGVIVINFIFYYFFLYGVLGVVVIQESYLVIYMWFEYGYVVVDFFICGEMDVWIFFDYLKKCFGVKIYFVIEMKCGLIQLLECNDFDIMFMCQKVLEWRNLEMYMCNVWFMDKDEDQVFLFCYIGEVFFDVWFFYQCVCIFELLKYGKFLILDDMFMMMEKDEFYYYEMIFYLFMFIYGNVKNIFVIGGGDGGMVCEFLCYDVEKVIMVEIDGEVIKVCKEFFFFIVVLFDDLCFELIVGDGIDYVKKVVVNFYDIIVVDGLDLVGLVEGLFFVEFYINCFNVLKEGGIFVVQGEFLKFNEKVFVELNEIFCQIFGKENVFVFLFYVFIYLIGMWSFQYGLKGFI